MKASGSAPCRTAVSALAVLQEAHRGKDRTGAAERSIGRCEPVASWNSRSIEKVTFHGVSRSIKAHRLPRARRWRQRWRGRSFTAPSPVVTGGDFFAHLDSLGGGACRAYPQSCPRVITPPVDNQISPTATVDISSSLFRGGFPIPKPQSRRYGHRGPAAAASDSGDGRR